MSDINLGPISLTQPDSSGDPYTTLVSYSDGRRLEDDDPHELIGNYFKDTLDCSLTPDQIDEIIKGTANINIYSNIGTQGVNTSIQSRIENADPANPTLPIIRTYVEISRTEITTAQPIIPNPWLGTNIFVQFAEIYQLMLRILLQNQRVKGAYEITTISLVYGMAKDMAAAIQSIAQTRMIQHITSAVVSGFSALGQGLSLGFSIKGAAAGAKARGPEPDVNKLTVDNVNQLRSNQVKVNCNPNGTIKDVVHDGVDIYPTHQKADWKNRYLGKPRDQYSLDCETTAKQQLKNEGVDLNTPEGKQALKERIRENDIIKANYRQQAYANRDEIKPNINDEIADPNSALATKLKGKTPAERQEIVQKEFNERMDNKLLNENNTGAIENAKLRKDTAEIKAKIEFDEWHENKKWAEYGQTARSFSYTVQEGFRAATEGVSAWAEHDVGTKEAFKTSLETIQQQIRTSGDHQTQSRDKDREDVARLMQDWTTNAQKLNDSVGALVRSR